MKNVKHITQSILFVAAIACLFTACQKEETLDIKQENTSLLDIETAKTDTPAEEEVKGLLSLPTGPGQTAECYIASVSVDVNCDGSYSVTGNEDYFSANLCWSRVYNLIYAYEAQGHCASPGIGACVQTTCFLR
ncbi:MAG: hypothetical protein AAFV95_08790 [Bacteroidota bacterium]